MAWLFFWRGQALGRAVETDAARPFARPLRLLGRVVEGDAAQPFTPRPVLGRPAELNEARPFTAAPIRRLAGVLETETALPLTVSRPPLPLMPYLLTVSVVESAFRVQVDEAGLEVAVDQPLSLVAVDEPLVGADVDESGGEFR